MQDRQALGQLDRLGVEGVLADHVGGPPAKLCEEQLEGAAELRDFAGQPSARHDQRPRHPGPDRDRYQLDTGDRGALRAVDPDFVATPGQAAGEVDQEGLGATGLDRQERRHQ